MNYFPDSERECHCGCGINNPSPLLINQLNMLREELGSGIYASSICRCPSYNKNIRSRDTSSHIATEDIQSSAADLKIPMDYKIAKKFCELVYKHFDRVGMNSQDRFVHVDIDTSKPSPAAWFYS